MHLFPQPKCWWPSKFWWPLQGQNLFSCVEYMAELGIFGWSTLLRVKYGVSKLIISNHLSAWSYPHSSSSHSSSVVPALTHIINTSLHSGTYPTAYSSPKNEDSVSNYSPSCCSNPVRLSFIFWTQIKIFLMKSKSYLSLS